MDPRGPSSLADWIALGVAVPGPGYATAEAALAARPEPVRTTGLPIDEVRMRLERLKACPDRTIEPG